MLRRSLAYAALAGLSAANLLLSGCVDDAQSPPSRPEPPLGNDASEGSMLAPVDLVYVCGNKFIATNATRARVQVTYRVAGTDESGGLALREGPGTDPGYSETELETSERGVVELYVDDHRVARRRNEGTSCGPPALSASVAGVGTPESAGEWSAPFNWPVVALHLSMLPDGRVLS